jgi:hypothetical protein
MSWELFVRRNYERTTQLGIGLKDLDHIKCGCGEHFTHQLVKFIICHHLLKLKHHFKTEQPVGKSICDIIDLNTFTIYEIESNLSPRIARKKLEVFYHPLIEDILIVDVRKLKNLKSALRLRDEIGKYCGLK